MIENAGPVQTLQDLRDQCDAIEECYEFLLAYAAQGLPADKGSSSGERLRPLLARASSALSSLPATYEAVIAQPGFLLADKHRAFLAVVSRDAADALAALELVMGLPAISSQMVDNLNASIHLRALLTDLFLIDEIARLQQSSTDQAKSAEI